MRNMSSLRIVTGTVRFTLLGILAVGFAASAPGQSLPVFHE